MFKVAFFCKYLKLPHFGKYLKLPQFDKYLKLPHFGKYLKLPYKVKCNQLFHFFEISTTCRHFWLFHKCNFHKVSYSNGWKEVSSLMSKPFANDICKLLSHQHFLMSNLKRAHDHLQNVISRSLARFWESFALGTSMQGKGPFTLPSLYCLPILANLYCVLCYF